MEAMATSALEFRDAPTPSLDAASEAVAANDLRAAAAAAFAEGRQDEALTLCEAGLAIVPDHADLRLLGAQSASAVGRHDDAVEWLEAGLASGERRGDFAYQRAKVAHYAGDQTAALHYIRLSEIEDPFSSPTVVLHARVLAALEREDDARRLLVEAIGYRPKALPLLFALARLVETPDHLETFYRLWLRTRRDDATFAATVRPLITACLRVRDFERARAALRRATSIVLDSAGAVAPVVRDRTLGQDGGRALVDVVRTLNTYGVPHFLAAGTALGAIRNGALLSFDTDIDIGIFEADFDKPKLVEIFSADPNFRIQDLDPVNPKVGLQHWNGVMLDLFIYFERDGKVWHSGTYTEWWNTPFGLQSVEIYGQTMKTPDPADLYLTECYDDWRTPRPEFDAFFEGPNAVVVWPEYFDTYLHRKAFELISVGRLDAAARYVARFPKVLGWLDLEAYGYQPAEPEATPESEARTDAAAEPHPDTGAVTP